MFTAPVSLRSLPLGLAGLACGLAFGACTAITNFADCKVDEDCAGAGNGYVCGPGNKCVPGDDETTSGDPGTSPTTSLPTTSTTEPPVTTTLETETDAVTSTTTSTTETTASTDPDTETTTTTGGPLTCTAHSECVAALGDDHVCGKAGECVSALTAECQTFHWPSDKPADKVVFVGSIMATSPPFDALVLPLQNAVQLAVEDFNANSDLPGGVKIAWIGCDDQGSADKATASLTHLSDTIGVPVVVGPIFSELVLLLADQAKASGTLLISPTASAKEITDLEDDGLVWRTIPSDVYQANAFADRIPQLTPAPQKVALLNKADAYGKSLHMDAFTRLMDKEPQLEITNHEYPNPVGLTQAELLQMYGTVIANAWGAPGDHPDTIGIIGTTEAIDIILGFMNAWSAENPDPPLPRFVVSHGVVAALPDLIAKAPAPLKPVLMQITEGVAPIIFDEANFNNFNIRYKIRFNDQAPITAASLSYDAAMVLMLAMAGVPEGEPIDGKNVAAAIAKLVDKAGTAVSFGEVMGLSLTFIKKARNILVTGGTVDLKGVSGALDFDLATGEVRVNLLGWGIDADMGMPDVGVLDPKRMYVLAPVPSTEGMWVDLP
ncbi:ABC transporter substrate-binding protein [Nannocystis punicea]|uniref:ABC transporter substrate-binding protein n=1 Tax=Nannocystis punicea TaxID=2995304 RepID=A0ABY7HHK7_9BACT|nr:ABC transporter substrate-binding protein [Nannocystis poenicansa]WAS98753.1 ABC transporter substrate-binding protein [Nannocystis poenicansa]